MRTVRKARRWLHTKRCMRSGANSREGLRAFFCDDRLLYGLVQAQIGHDPLELAVFILHLTQAAKLGRTDTAITLLPDVESLLANTHLATDLLDTDTLLGLIEGKSDLFLGEFALLHEMLPHIQGVPLVSSLCTRTVRNPGTGSSQDAASGMAASEELLIIA